MAHAEEEIDERREAAARDAPDDIPPVLLEQAVLMTDAVVLEPDRTRFGFPVAVMLLGVGRAADASIDAVADAAMEASRRWTSGTNPPVRNVRRRWDQAAGYPALSIALDVRIAARIGSWFAGPALRLLGFDPVRVRAVIFDRADRRHLAAIGAANRGADRQLAAFDQVLASSEWTA